MKLFSIFTKIREAKEEAKKAKNPEKYKNKKVEEDKEDEMESHKADLKQDIRKNPSLKKQRLKKSKREKRREKENANFYYEIFRGLLGDRDYRTKQGITSILLLISAIALFVFGVFYVIAGTAKYSSYQKNNTTPIGEQMEFGRSEASVKFGGVWTDKKRDVTMVKIKYDKKARNLLSTQGSNYKIFVVDKKGKLQNKVKMSYGILGTEGDGFLFIKGKLDEKAYHIILTNQLNLTSGSASFSGNDAGTDSEAEKLAKNNDEKLTTSELESSLSELNNDDVDKKGRFKFGGKHHKPNVDFIDFRVNSYSKSTKVYNGSFLTSNGDIDYSKVIDKSSVQKVLKAIDKDIEKTEKKNKQYEDSINEFKKRLKRNKDDEDSESNIKSLEKKKEENEETQKRLKNLKERYQEESFDKSSFGDMQEHFKSISAEK